MPFWKQSEDPWDRKPDKPRQPPKDPQANPLDSLNAWNAERKAKAKEKEEARRLPPEPCPWCGKEMEQGFLFGGRDGVRWHPGIYKYDPLRSFDGDAVNLLDEGGPFVGYYKTAWLCRTCKKLVLDMPESPVCGDGFPAPAAEPANNTQEEETSEE